MALTQAQLLAQQSQSDLRTSLDAKYAAIPIDISSWAPSSQGGTENANNDAVCAELAAFAAPIVTKTARSRFLDRATLDELTLHASKFFRLDRRLAQPTIQTIALTLIKGGPTYDYPAGELWFKSATGNQYRSQDDFHIQDDPSSKSQTTVSIRAYCTTPGAKANEDVANTITQMETPLPGISCANVAASEWSTAVLSGASSGTIVPHFVTLGTPPTSYTTLKVRIDASGDAEAGSGSYSIDGGRTWTSFGVLHSSVAIDAFTRLEFQNGATHPSFLINNVFSFSVANAIVQRGTDDETDVALRKRCRNRWPALSDVPTAGLIDLWAHQASVEVDRVLTEADQLHAGWINVRIAAIDGPPSGQALSAVQDYITARLNAQSGGLEHASVSSVDVLICNTISTVFVSGAKLAATQIAADEGWTSYLQSVPIGGRILFSSLVEIIMDAGADDMDGGNTAINDTPLYVGFVQLGPTQVAVSAAGGLIAGVAWIVT